MSAVFDGVVAQRIGDILLYRMAHIALNVCDKLDALIKKRLAFDRADPAANDDVYSLRL